MTEQCTLYVQEEKIASKIGSQNLKVAIIVVKLYVYDRFRVAVVLNSGVTFLDSKCSFS
jgi:hypothetical protein